MHTTQIQKRVYAGGMRAHAQAHEHTALPFGPGASQREIRLQRRVEGFSQLLEKEPC